MANDPTRRGPGAPEAKSDPYGKNAPPDERTGPEADSGLPEHRQMAVRRDLGEGDIEASEYEDEMSHPPSRE